MKKVLIATPCLDQKVDAYYVHSLCESIKLGKEHDFDINVVFLANESILPMARNELFNLAYHQNYDIMVFIDDDEYWDAKALVEILLSDRSVVTIPVVNKTDKQTKFNVDLESKNMDAYGYAQAKTTGTGFLKITREVFTKLWESNTELEFRGKKLKNICEYTMSNGSFVGEDITLSKKITELGYKIWVYTNHTVSHIGNKMYVGDFTKTL